jgi:hypothetical protein
MGDTVAAGGLDPSGLTAPAGSFELLPASRSSRTVSPILFYPWVSWVLQARSIADFVHFLRRAECLIRSSRSDTTASQEDERFHGRTLLVASRLLRPGGPPSSQLGLGPRSENEGSISNATGPSPPTRPHLGVLHRIGDRVEVSDIGLPPRRSTNA